MNLGQVWSSADFDGIDSMGSEMNHQGGRGSVVAVCGQNPNLDAPLNADVGDISIDWPDLPNDDLDRVRGFFSQHSTGALFGFADGSTKFITESIDMQTYRHLSTRNGQEILGEF